MFTALRIGTLYFGSSFLTANWLTRMPDLLAHLGVDKATMGLALFLISDIAKVSMRAVLKEMIPFYIPLFGTLVIITLFPELTLWLPKMLR